MDKLLENYHKLSPEKQNLLKIMLEEKGVDLNSRFILPQDREKKIFPMSYAQQRLWFLEQLDPQNLTYIIPVGVKIEGDFRINLLSEAINLVISRHEILRTKFIEIEGEGFQEIIDDIKIKVEEINLLNFSEADIEKRIVDEVSKPFDLSQCPLFRIIVIKKLENFFYLLIPMHHIISDNWSTGIFIKEIIQIYTSKLNQQTVELDKLPIQYADFSVWQRGWLKGKELEKQKNYWLNQLNDSNHIIELIPDKIRPINQTNNGSFELFKIDPNLTAQILSFCKQEDLTQFIFLISVYQFLLSKYSNQNDINVGVPIANRNRVEIENLIGFFINTLVFRNKIDLNSTVTDYLNYTKKISIEAYDNQDVPFEIILHELNLERDMSHTALFQAMFVLNNAPLPQLKIGNLKIEPFEIDLKKTKFDLILSLTLMGSEFLGKFEYNTDIYKQGTILNLIENFTFIIKEFINKKDLKLKFVKLLSEETKLSYLKKAQFDFEKNNSDFFIHQLFEKSVILFGDKIAITDSNNSITYNQLNNNSNKIANFLIEKCVKREERIGIFIDRSIEFIISIIGIMKAGAVFVPLDINYPKERLNYIIKDSKIKFILTQKEFLEKVNGFSGTILLDDVIQRYLTDLNTSIKIAPNSLAYVIYTSGSTGEPKGVMVEHDKIANHIKQMIIDFGINYADKYLQFASFNFDASIEQIFVPLLSGAEIYLRNNTYWGASEFIRLLKEQNITVINPPTIYWNQIVNEIIEQKINDISPVRLVIVGGEEMKVELLNNWKEKISDKIELINAYGPTETIITSAMLKTKKGEVEINDLHVPIGKCLGNREVYVLDKFGELVPPGIPGELCFGGDYIARGYQSNPSLTAEKFIPNSFTSDFGGRIYKTGDLARYNTQGSIEYLGRIDNQVKLRGFRIELGEIDQTFLRNPKVQNVATLIIDVNKNDPTIVSFIVPKIKDDNLVKELKSYCKKNLPAFMIPGTIILVEEIPINLNGKIDKNALAKLFDNHTNDKVEYVAPRTELEETITNIVIDLLKINKVGVFDNFFELGGHSILAIKLISKLRSVFGVELELKKLFENPTIEGIAESIISEQMKFVDHSDLEKILNELNN